MKYYRCDRCKKELTDDERQAPFIRLDNQIRAVATVMVFDDRGKEMSELCAQCKTDIVQNGKPVLSMTIDNNYLRDQVAPPPAPAMAVLAAPEIVEPIVYEPSLPIVPPPPGFVAAEPQIEGEHDVVLDAIRKESLHEE